MSEFLNDRIDSPQQSETAVIIVAILLLAGGALYGFKTWGARGAVLGVLGPAVWALWKAHQGLTGYFGLDKVKVLALEAVVFIALGAALAIVWNKVSRQNLKGN